MKLLIVIVNFKSAALTIGCLRSLAPEIQGFPGAKVVVTDCASNDGSVEAIELEIATHAWQRWASVMPLLKNGGFAFGNNAAIRPALRSDDPPEYVLLLNPDTLVRPGGVSHLVDFMDAWPNVGIAGSRLEDPDGRPQRSAFRFPSVASEFENGIRLGVVSKIFASSVVAPPVPDGRREVDWVAGASMIVRRAVFDQIGLMDEQYFLYYEEVDFCIRAKNAGFPCWYVPASRVIHLVGQSSGVTDVKQRKRRPAYWFASRRRYFLKHLGGWRTFAADMAWALGAAMHRIRRIVTFRPNVDPPALWWDFVKYNFFVVPTVSEFKANIRHSTLPPTSAMEEPLHPEPVTAAKIGLSKRTAAGDAPGKSTSAATGGVDATSALWAALKRDAARERSAEDRANKAAAEPPAVERLGADRIKPKAERP